MWQPVRREQPSSLFGVWKHCETQFLVQNGPCGWSENHFRRTVSEGERWVGRCWDHWMLKNRLREVWELPFEREDISHTHTFWGEIMGDPSVCFSSKCVSVLSAQECASVIPLALHRSLSPLVGSGLAQVINKPVWIEEDAQTQTRRPREFGGSLRGRGHPGLNSRQPGLAQTRADRTTRLIFTTFELSFLGHRSARYNSVGVCVLSTEDWCSALRLPSLFFFHICVWGPDKISGTPTCKSESLHYIVWDDQCTLRTFIFVCTQLQMLKCGKKKKNYMWFHNPVARSSQSRNTFSWQCQKLPLSSPLNMFSLPLHHEADLSAHFSAPLPRNYLLLLSHPCFQASGRERRNGGF